MYNIYVRRNKNFKEEMTLLSTVNTCEEVMRIAIQELEKDTIYILPVGDFGLSELKAHSADYTDLILSNTILEHFFVEEKQAHNPRVCSHCKRLLEDDKGNLLDEDNGFLFVNNLMTGKNEIVCEKCSAYNGSVYLLPVNKAYDYYLLDLKFGIKSFGCFLERVSSLSKDQLVSLRNIVDRMQKE